MALLNRLPMDVLASVAGFVRQSSGMRLRAYQEDAALAIVKSVVERSGLTFVVVFPRQSGKNELQAQIKAYLLRLFCPYEVEMVKISPTWKPQSLNAMRRLERVLNNNRLTRDIWEKEQGYIYRIGKARIFFLSGSPTANVVGATASLLLSRDEAQDVPIDKWDKEINPMAASTNATRVFWGTAWTNQTLLRREMELAGQAEQSDGRRRVFRLTADEVRREVPAYGLFVDGEIAGLGRGHPFVRSQFFCEDVATEGGRFPARLQALMQGEHSWEDRARAGADAQTPAGGGVAFLIDVGGEAGAADDRSEAWQLSFLPGGGHDAATLTIVEVDLEPLADPLIAAPRYRVVHRRSWQGAGQVQLYA